MRKDVLMASTSGIRATGSGSGEYVKEMVLKYCIPRALGRGKLNSRLSLTPKIVGTSLMNLNQ